MEVLEKFISDLEKTKIGDKYTDFCIEEAIFHIKKAIEVIQAPDPKERYYESFFQAKVITKSFPFIFAVQELELQAQQDSDSEESL
jgi:hypothetical protein